MSKSDQDVKGILEKVLKMPVGDLRRYGIALDGKDPASLTKAELLVIQLVERGCVGDLSAIREIFDRLLGKPVQHNENVNKSVSYYDFLLQIVHEEKLTGKVSRETTPPPKEIEVKAEPVDELADHPGNDLLDELDQT